MSQHLEHSFSVVVHDVSAESNDGFHDELHEASLQLSTIISKIFSLPFLSLLVIVVITPQFLHHLIEVDLELLSIDSGESSQSEGPSEES